MTNHKAVLSTLSDTVKLIHMYLVLAGCQARAVLRTTNQAHNQPGLSQGSHRLGISVTKVLGTGSCIKVLLGMSPFLIPILLSSFHLQLSYFNLHLQHL